jgi:hypothetical protein
MRWGKRNILALSIKYTMTEPDGATTIDEINARLVLRTNKWHIKAALKYCTRLRWPISWVTSCVLCVRYILVKKKLSNERNLLVTACDSLQKTLKWLSTGVSNKTVTVNYELLWLPTRLKAQVSWMNGKKVKVNLEGALNAQWGSRGIALLFI